jgi:AraC-like DNA-binding protein
MGPRRNHDRPVTAVQYQPPPGYGFDVEIYRHEELRRRAQAVGERLERIDFHVLLYLTRGGYEHVLDFDAIECGAGSLVILRPGQVHRFGDTARFFGWLIIFRAEVLPPRGADANAPMLDLSRQLEALPTHVRVPRPDQRAMTEAIERMASDAARPASPMVNALIISQLHSLLLRLQVIEADADDAPVDLAVMDRYRRYRAAIEIHYREWQSVQRYAKHLGCSTKSLNRAARAVSDTTAKRLITDRVVLEAKRLLVHTSANVAAIADELGFDEATNFVKLFRHETGVTPGAFRRRHPP